MTRPLWQALPRGWRGPAFAVRFSRAWAFSMTATLIAGALATALTFRVPAEASFVVVVLAVVLAFVMSRGLVGDDRSRGRWVMMFQRPAAPWVHYARSAVLTFTGVTALLVVAWIPYAVAGSWMDVSVRERVGTLAGALVYASVIFAIGAAMSALVRRNDSSLVVLILFVSYLQVAIGRAFGVSAAVQDAFRWCFMPVDGMQAAYQWFAAPRGPILPAYIGQLIIFPALFLAAGALRLRRLASVDITSVTAD